MLYKHPYTCHPSVSMQSENKLYSVVENPFQKESIIRVVLQVANAVKSLKLKLNKIQFSPVFLVRALKYIVHGKIFFASWVGDKNQQLKVKFSCFVH